MNLAAHPASPSPSRPQTVAFGAFVLDFRAAALRRDGQPVAVRPRPFEVLSVLVQRAGELVTKDELLDAVWGTRFVTEGVIKTAIAELRDVLGDDPKTARWIQTVARRGYRFMPDPGDQAASERFAVSGTSATTAHPGQESGLVVRIGGLVGREDALAALGQIWQTVRDGQRRIAFVSGDPGVGKSALAAAFVDGLPEGALVAHGQCVESFGRGEPYLPWLETLEALRVSSDDLPQWLKRYAPSWLAQMPWLLDAEHAVAAEAGAGERMPREMTTLLEQLSQRAPLVLVLEDMHWSDHASAQLIDYLARRRTSARILLLCTFRATDLLVAEHPLADIRRELRLHRLADEIGLDGLDRAGLHRLLTDWCPGVSWSPPELAALHAHTEGVPLFVRAVIDALVAGQVLRTDASGRWLRERPLPQHIPLPDDLAGLFGQQLLALLPSQRELLEAAAVAGVEFDAAVLASALDRDRSEVHALCDGLVRGGRWLQAAGIESRSPGPPSGRYRFGHALMQSLCYARCGAARRIELHRRVAQALLDAHGARSSELAVELAYHFEQALDAHGALPWLQRAVELAWQRLAPHERLALAQRAQALLPRCGPSVDSSTLARWRYYFAHAGASALTHITGYAGPAVAAALDEALAASIGQPVDAELLNLYRIGWMRLALSGQFDEALAQAEIAVSRAAASADAGCQVQALSMLHFSAFKCGAFESARAAIARAEALAPQVQPTGSLWIRFFARMGHERLLMTAMMDSLQGRPEAVDALDLRRRIADPEGPVVGRVLNGVLCELWRAWCDDPQAVADDAQAMLDLVEREGMVSGGAAHRVLLHWAEGVLGDPARALPRLRSALEGVEQDERVADRAAFLDLAADLALRAGDVSAAAADIDEAFAHVGRTGERYVLPRLWARRARIAERQTDPRKAERMRERERRAQADPASAPLD